MIVEQERLNRALIGGRERIVFERLRGNPGELLHTKRARLTDESTPIHRKTQVVFGTASQMRRRWYGR